MLSLPHAWHTPQSSPSHCSPGSPEGLPVEHLGTVLRILYQTHSRFPPPEPPSEDLGSLHPGALLFRAAGNPPSLPTMADALAHGADVNWVNAGQENATPLIQATAAVSLTDLPVP